MPHLDLGGEGGDECESFEGKARRMTPNAHASSTES